ncbi:MAG: DUF4412 domain-containing protein [Vicinamibacterales bacterium]|jgi:hypothetical protein|nr:hypothetical protein [Acidobacteriota bacterium]MDP7293985.1 DUF4412 domain-containing protein [Vicinamibacterales bacterium]MDP7471944.1 DUF4412 domain-containing protein [Vicinamibacterales bacterium]MDP7672602.1 DUF4412 domain-containing protein [Vicinamibacterales bacterium]HJO38787.1 DUF4412 domain-containing protein [Vicinamibacterales bacterium]|tara:strand:- start:1757 stop:2551 length:795 start_codon:yes stop_codon:yes gene_type:complete
MSMTLSPRVARILISLSAVYLVQAGVFPRHAAGQPEEFSAIVQIEQDSNETMEMTYYVAPGRVRMDLPQASMIWTGGDESSMLMVQHSERHYMEWGGEQMKMMQQMMSRMGRGGADGGAAAAPTEPPADLRFETAGNRETIQGWDAFEVFVESSEGEDRFWLTEDTEIGLFEVLSSFADIAGSMQMPMGMGQAQQEPQAMMSRYQQMARAQGLPEGRAVRIVSDAEDAANITLVGVQVSTAPDGTFTPPADYEKMEMLAFPGRR